MNNQREYPSHLLQFVKCVLYDQACFGIFIDCGLFVATLFISIVHDGLGSSTPTKSGSDNGWMDGCARLSLITGKWSDHIKHKSTSHVFMPWTSLIMDFGGRGGCFINFYCGWRRFSSINFKRSHYISSDYYCIWPSILLTCLWLCIISIRSLVMYTTKQPWIEASVWLYLNKIWIFVLTSRCLLK